MRPFLLMLAIVVAASAALEDPSARLGEMEKAYRAQRAAYLREWLSRANLDPVPVPLPENTKDARPSEKRAQHHAEEVNKILAEAKRIREHRAQEGMAPAEGEIWTVERPAAVAAILEAQAGRAPASAPIAGKEHKAPSGGFVSRPETEPAGNR